jgi:hypothetical protein
MTVIFRFIRAARNEIRQRPLPLQVGISENRVFWAGRESRSVAKVGWVRLRNTGGRRPEVQFIRSAHCGLGVSCLVRLCFKPGWSGDLGSRAHEADDAM